MNSVRSWLLAFGLGSSVGLCVAAETTDVSLIQLIANPVAYHERPVRVEGFLSLEFEGTALYLHREDYEHGLLRNSVCIADRGILERRGARDLRYVLIEGGFDADEHCHFGGWIGAIKDIRRAEPALSR